MYPHHKIMRRNQYTPPKAPPTTNHATIWTSIRLFTTPSTSTSDTPSPSTLETVTGTPVQASTSSKLPPVLNTDHAQPLSHRMSRIRPTTKNSNCCLHRKESNIHLAFYLTANVSSSTSHPLPNGNRTSP